MCEDTGQVEEEKEEEKKGKHENLLKAISHATNNL